MAVINPITSPVITDEITPDFFEIFRERIAEIILIELQNQYLITGNSDYNFSKIWIERTSTFNLSEVPAINLSIGSLTYGDKHRGQRWTDVVYNIDVYTSKVHEADYFADTLSQKAVWNIARVLEYILDHPEYAALKAPPYVRHTSVGEVVMGQSEVDGAGKVSVLRLEFSVNTLSQQGVIYPINVTGIDTTVTLDQSDKGYFYQKNY